MNNLQKKYIKTDVQLDAILSLTDNWNNNGAKAFDSDFVEYCRQIIKQLPYEPFVCPTACGSIQLEWEYNNQYLEFEIYKNKIEIYMKKENNEEKEICYTELNINELRQIIFNFYNQNS